MRSSQGSARTDVDKYCVSANPARPKRVSGVVERGDRDRRLQSFLSQELHVAATRISRCQVMHRATRVKLIWSLICAELAWRKI